MKKKERKEKSRRPSLFTYIRAKILTLNNHMVGTLFRPTYQDDNITIDLTNKIIKEHGLDKFRYHYMHNNYDTFVYIQNSLFNSVDMRKTGWYLGNGIINVDKLASFLIGRDVEVLYGEGIIPSWISLYDIRVYKDLSSYIVIVKKIKIEKEYTVYNELLSLVKMKTKYHV